MHRQRSLKHRLLQGTPLFGMFTRLADPDAVEALAASALDFVVLDAEHGALDRADIHRIVGAACARDLPVLVRVPSAAAADIHHALAAGASGIIVPHIASGAEAQTVVDLVRSAALQRAYAGMGRAADYRRPGWPSFQQAMHAQFLTVAQIDDTAGLAAAAEIADVPHVDAVFVGALSLALALDQPDLGAMAVQQAVAAICDACKHAGRRVGMHVLDAGTRATWAELGVNLFVIGNDLNLLRQGADAAVQAFRGQD